MTSILRNGLVLITCMYTFQVDGELLENVEYGRAGETSLRLDARIPAGKGPFASAVIVHGGAWVTGDRRRSVQALFQPLASAHIANFSISYRLARQTSDVSSLSNNLAQMLSIGSQIDDVRQAVAYVRSHAAEFRIDPDRIALIGESAGAQLASMAALRPGAGARVRAVVALYAPNDLPKLIQSSAWIPDGIRQSLDGSYFAKLLFAGLRDLSPVYWVSKDAPPFLLIHGTADALVPFEQSEEFCEKLRASGVRCEIYPVTGGQHGLMWWEAEGRTAYKQHMVQWLERELR